MSAVQLAALSGKSLVLPVRRDARTGLRGVWGNLEHILDARTLPGVRPRLALDHVPELSTTLAA